MLSILFIIPVIGSFILTLISNENKIKIIALITSIITFGISLILWVQFDDNFHEFQFVQEWSTIGFCHFHVGIDGLSLFFLILTTFIITISILASWTSVHTNLKSFLISFLLLESFLIAVFIVLDLFLFYITFESCLIPMTLILGVWGYQKRVRAAFYLFLYTMTGSLFMLFSILFLLNITGTTDFQSLYLATISTEAQFLIWLGFFFAFAVKTPLVPLHVWLLKLQSKILGGFFILILSLFIINTSFINDLFISSNLFLISFIPIKLYSNADSMRLEILKDNRDKSGIYRWVNNVNGKSYICSAIDLNKRLKEHFYNDKSNIRLQRAILKYGLSKISLEILEYCDVSLLI